ncbi:unnamed protein product [Caenorhabditis brenneri]
MSAMKPIIVFIMLLVPSLCDGIFPPIPTAPPEPDFGSPEEFLKEVNEIRAKIAKEYKIPNMYKLVWSNELVEQLNYSSDAARLKDGADELFIRSYRKQAELIDAAIKKYKDLDQIRMSIKAPVLLISPLDTFIGCTPYWDALREWQLRCLMGFIENFGFRYADPGEAGSQCSSRFKAEDGLCVPKDPSKHTFWGTEEGLLEDVNYMRRKYAKKFGIPNMHQLTWNESLVEVLKSLDLKRAQVGIILNKYLSSSDSSWDGFGNNWRITELMSFSASVLTIDQAVLDRYVLNRSIWKTMIRGEKEESATAEEMIHPLQTSIGCMKKERELNGRFFNILTACLLGNIGQWPSDWKLDVNSTKIPGSECMERYVNDDGLCSIPLPTSAPPPAQNVPKEPEVTRAPESEQEEEAESSSTTKFSYGLWILYLIVFFF